MTHSAGAVVLFLEVRKPTEQHKALVSQFASFMHSFIGRGVCEYRLSLGGGVGRVEVDEGEGEGRGWPVNDGQDWQPAS